MKEMVMRNVFVVVALMTAVGGGLSFTQRAEAGVSYQLVFRSTDILGGAVSGNLVGTSTYSFPAATGFNCNPVTGAGCAVTDVMLINTDALIFNSISVSFDNTFGLSVVSADEWNGTSTGPMMTPGTYVPIAPGVTIGASSIESFDGNQAPPSGPPSLQAGTYNIGTIVWDTSAWDEQDSALGFFLNVLDATGAVLPAGSMNIIDISGTETLIPGAIIWTPEPATAGLLGLGLVGLVLARRRRF